MLKTLYRHWKWFNLLLDNQSQAQVNPNMKSGEKAMGNDQSLSDSLESASDIVARGV